MQQGGPALHVEWFPDLRNHYILPRHCRHELRGVLIEHRDGAIMNWHDRVEAEKLLAGERGCLGSHGETVADGDETDLRSENFLDKSHVAENLGITHVIKGLAQPLDNNAARVPKIHGLAVDGGRRRVESLYEADGHASAKVDRPAGVCRFDLLDALPGEEHRDLIGGDKRGSGAFANAGRVADMVVMTVGEHNVCCAARCFLYGALDFGVVR